MNVLTNLLIQQVNINQISNFKYQQFNTKNNKYKKIKNIFHMHNILEKSHLFF